MVQKQNFNPPTPRGVGPRSPIRLTRPNRHFNPPTPREVGLVAYRAKAQRELFQSTHPAWGGTLLEHGHQLWQVEISIHPPRVG